MCDACWLPAWRERNGERTAKMEPTSSTNSALSSHNVQSAGSCVCSALCVGPLNSKHRKPVLTPPTQCLPPASCETALPLPLGLWGWGRWIMNQRTFGQETLITPSLYRLSLRLWNDTYWCKAWEPQCYRGTLRNCKHSISRKTAIPYKLNTDVLTSLFHSLGILNNKNPQTRVNCSQAPRK